MKLNLTALRKALSAQLKIDLGLIDIARATGINPVLYGRYEANKVTRPELANMEKIYRFYHERGLRVRGRPVELGDLFTLEG